MELGKVLILIGAAFLTFGILLTVLPKDIHPLAWFGKLPGDISYSNNGASIFIPITSMIIVSVVVTVALKLLRWLGSPR
jgi:hypothetical protein